jgi:hypothetical protein
VRLPDTLPVVLAGFALVLFRVRKRHLRLAPIRESTTHEPVFLRTRAAVKPRLQFGHWSTKTLALMELSVGSQTVWLVTRPECVGAVLGSQWYFVARETQIRRTRGPRDPLQREWIVLHGMSGGAEVEIAVSTPIAPDIVWGALLQAGCKTDE